MENKNNNPDWAPYDGSDTNYQGAAAVVQAELELIKKRRPGATATDLTGLALSGGGIRSASFCLGVMQALARAGWLKRLDYLSTVSGGGYIGSSLTWLLHKEWSIKNTAGDTSKIRFDTGAENFPYRTEPVWSTQTQTIPKDPTPAEIRLRHIKGSMLRWLRQNGKFLTPGGGLNLAALGAVVLRGTALSMMIYLSLLVLVFLGLNGLDQLLEYSAAFLAAKVGVGLFVVITLLYAMSTFFFSASGKAHPTDDDDNPCAGMITSRYCWRRWVERNLGRILTLSLLFGLLGALPALIDLIPGNKEEIAATFGGISTLIGVATSFGLFAKGGTNKPSMWSAPVIGIASVLLLLGVLVLAHEIARALWPLVLNGPHEPLYIWLGVLSALGILTNVNHISVHRYYRDRLMETFMPNVSEAVRRGGSRPGASVAADRARLHEMCGVDDTPHGPYHLINTNIVLVESGKPKFKGRGGDNFIMSPLYCGSNATGWRRSSSFMGGNMTLATAMAISGAAVNPSAGCGGEGVTRRPVLSMLMGILNIRLGYWTPNPDPAKTLWTLPNFFWPGLWELAMRKRLNEDSRFIQLSDGGHFENLALYELIRRKLKLIVVCDGGADPQFTFSDLANAIEKVRVDFGALISITCNDLAPLTPRVQTEGDCPGKYAERGWLIADIYYSDRTQGKLIYFTTTFTRKLSVDLFGYRNEHPEFPDEPTGDQFFDEKQFEAYRELGFQLAWDMANELWGAGLFE